MKIYKYDCIGRVPSSIKDLEKCEMCQNEEICTGLWSGIQVDSSATADYSLEEEKKEYSVPAAQRA